jgi:hypothetical protein
MRTSMKQSTVLAQSGDGSITDDFSTALAGWLGSSGFAVAGGAATITPTENTERVANGDFESWASPTNANSWTEQIAGTSTVNQETTNFHGGANAVRYSYDGSGSQARVFQSTTAPNNTWCITRYWARGGDTVPQVNFAGTGIGLNSNPNRSLTTSYQEFLANGLTTVVNPQIFPDSAGTVANKTVYYDDISIKDLTLASMFALRSSLLSTNVVVKATPTIVVGTFAGVAACVDSTSAPANFLLGITDAGTARLYKCVAGTYTLLKSGNITYSAGATIEIRKVGTTVGLYYNNVQVSTDATVSDEGIISNTYHGIWAGYGGNSFNSFILAAA